MMQDKDTDRMLEEMVPLAQEFVCIHPDSQRAMDQNDMCRMLRERYGVQATACQTVNEGIRTAIKKREIMQWSARWDRCILPERFKAFLKRRTVSLIFFQTVKYPTKALGSLTNRLRNGIINFDYEDKMWVEESATFLCSQNKRPVG